MPMSSTIFLNVKLWAYFVATMRQTGVSDVGVCVFQPADHMKSRNLIFKENVCKNRSSTFVSL